MKSWIVPSQTDPRRNYVVMLNDDGSWSCDCPDHRYRGRECKHIYAVKLMLGMAGAELAADAHGGLKPRALASSIEVGGASRAIEEEPRYLEHPMIRPGAVERRGYQLEIVDEVLKSGNCLVVLPTALGKTVIAELVAAELLHRHPGSRILVMAPTKPLAMQHRESFLRHLNIGPGEAGLATGEVDPGSREVIWRSPGVRCVFATPQTVWSDYRRGYVRLQEFALLVMDECHRSRSRYAYTRLAAEYVRRCPWPRILALTASPGSEEEKVLEVVRNLYIERIVWRTEEDVAAYIPGVDVRWIRLELPEPYEKVRGLIKSMIESRAEKLYEAGLLRVPRENLNRRTFVSLMNRLRAEIDSGVRGANMHYMALCSEILSLYHALELVESQGGYSLKRYLERVVSSELRSHRMLAKSPDFQRLVEAAGGLERLDHPKIEILPALLDQHLRERPGDRIIIFANIRDTAERIVEALGERGFRARIFVGRGGDQGPGMSQEEQVRVLNAFRRGEFNILVATSIGEEGLDIPECGYVIFYEPAVSGIRYIQRRGRTGRRLPGKVTILVAEGTVDEYYHREGYRRARRMERILKAVSEKISGFKIERIGPEPEPGRPWPWIGEAAIEVGEEAPGEGPREELEAPERPAREEEEIEEREVSFRDLYNCYKAAYMLLLKAGARGMRMGELMEELEGFEAAVVNAAVGRLVRRGLAVKSGDRYYLKAALRGARAGGGELYTIEVEKVYPGFAVVIVNDRFRARLESWAYYGPRDLLKKGSRLRVRATLRRENGSMTIMIHDVVGVEP